MVNVLDLMARKNDGDRRGLLALGRALAQARFDGPGEHGRPPISARYGLSRGIRVS